MVAFWRCGDGIREGTFWFVFDDDVQEVHGIFGEFHRISRVDDKPRILWRSPLFRIALQLVCHLIVLPLLITRDQTVSATSLAIE